MTSPIGSNVLSTVNSSGAANLRSQQSDELRDNFMTLMIAQLQNQDPLSPMENNELTSQLAQINTVSGIEQLNDTMKGITSQISAGQTLQATSLIGQGVLVPGDRVLLETDAEGGVHTTPFGFDLSAPADQVRVTVVGGDGQVINQYNLGALGAGVDSFNWNGKNAQGETVVSGSYRVRVEASNDGKNVPVESLNYAVVGSVTPANDKGGVKLDLGAVYGQVSLDQVRQIL